MNRRDALHSLAILGLFPLDKDLNFADPLLQKRAIPGQQEQLPVIGVGTWETFDVTPSQHTILKELKEVLNSLVEKGGSVIDSSPMYGFAEQNVGQLSAELNINQRLFIATKVWTQGREKGIAQMNNSLALLKRKQLDLLQIHNLVDWQIHIKNLRQWKDMKKVRYIGITHYQESAYDEMERIMKTEPIDFIQVNYNVMDRKSADRLLPLAQEKNIAVIISQPFGYGKLFQKVGGKKLPTWAGEIECNSWAQLFLKFIIAHPAVTCVIPGTGNPVHMLDNLAAGMGKLPNEKQKEMIMKELA